MMLTEVTIFLSALGFKGTIKELNELYVDKIRGYRFTNQLRILEKAQALCQEKGIQPNRIPERILAPLLEKASFEDNEDLQGRWAALITNAAKKADNNIHPSYINILSQLTPVEAQLLDEIYDNNLSDEKTGITRGKMRKIFSEKLSFPENLFEIACDNLIRLNLLLPYFKKYADDREGSDIMLGNANVYIFNDLAKSFIENCRPPLAQ